MKIESILTKEKVTLVATPSEEDTNFWDGKKAKLGRHFADFELPSGFSDFRIHPDALALLGLLIFGPFAAKKIEFSWGISSYFASTAQSCFRRRLSPVDPLIMKRAAIDYGRDALAFSGGVDSVAALCLLPSNSLPIFMHRTIPDGVKIGLYRSEAAIKSCDSVRTSGRDVCIVNTNMEYSRDPVGFAVDWTNAAGAVLLSDAYKLRSIAFGMIAESAFFLGHAHYSDLSERSVFKAWAPMFEAIGLPICLPTSGLSEVITTKIAGQSSWFSQSCVRGTADTPCGRCFKCFRKPIIDSAVFGHKLPAKHFDAAYESNEIKRRLLEAPIHHENVMAFSIHNTKCDDHPVLRALRQKTEPLMNYADNLKFMDKLFPRGTDYVPKFLRDEVSTKIAAFAPEATNDEINIIKNWEIGHLTHTPKYVESNSILERELSGR